MSIIGFRCAGGKNYHFKITDDFSDKDCDNFIQAKEGCNNFIYNNIMFMIVIHNNKINYFGYTGNGFMFYAPRKVEIEKFSIKITNKDSVVIKKDIIKQRNYYLVIWCDSKCTIMEHRNYYNYNYPGKERDSYFVFDKKIKTTKGDILITDKTISFNYAGGHVIEYKLGETVEIPKMYISIKEDKIYVSNKSGSYIIDEKTDKIITKIPELGSFYYEGNYKFRFDVEDKEFIFKEGEGYKITQEMKKISPKGSTQRYIEYLHDKFDQKIINKN